MYKKTSSLFEIDRDWFKQVQDTYAEESSRAVKVALMYFDINNISVLFDETLARDQYQQEFTLNNVFEAFKRVLAKYELNNLPEHLGFTMYIDRPSQGKFFAKNILPVFTDENIQAVQKKIEGFLKVKPKPKTNTNTKTNPYKQKPAEAPKDEPEIQTKAKTQIDPLDEFLAYVEQTDLAKIDLPKFKELLPKDMILLKFLRKFFHSDKFHSDTPENQRKLDAIFILINTEIENINNNFN